MNGLTVFQDDLVTVFQDNAVTTSLCVAEVFDKRHDKVLRAIENLIEGLPKNEQTPQMFFKSTFERWSTSTGSKMSPLKF